MGGEHFRTPAHDARAGQLDAARAGLAMRAEDFLHFPWPDLDGVVRGIAPGKIWMLAGYSGTAGKTTFLTNLTLQWIGQGVSVYYLPLETPPDEILRRLACLAVGVPVGDVLTGDCLAWPNWQEVERRLDTQLAQWALAADDPDGGAWPLYVHPADRADAGVIAEATLEASMLGCDVLIVDHVDHLSGDPARGDYGVSVDVMRALDAARKRDPSLRQILATQLSQEAVRGDPLAKFLPPTESAIKMGGHKREVVDGVLGLYRPLKRGTTADQLKQVRARLLDPYTIVAPGEMGVEVQKHRARGDLAGRQCVLRLTDTGQVEHYPERDRYSTDYESLRRV